MGFMGKESLWKNKYFGAFISHLGAYPVNRPEDQPAPPPQPQLPGDASAQRADAFVEFAQRDQHQRDAPVRAGRALEEGLAAVVERANKVIKQIFDQEKYDLILQEVVFAGPRVDITKKVIDALNAGK